MRNVLLALGKHGAAKNADIQVRLSLQSEPANYQIIEIMDPETGQSMALDAYSGKTHRQLSYNDRLALTLWSDQSACFADVQELIGALRNAAKAEQYRDSS